MKLFPHKTTLQVNIFIQNCAYKDSFYHEKLSKLVKTFRIIIFHTCLALQKLLCRFIFYRQLQIDFHKKIILNSFNLQEPADLCHQCQESSCGALNVRQ